MPATDLSGLTTEVSEATTVMDSAATLIGGLAQKLRDAANDPSAVQALADSLDQHANALSAAVVANTPAA